MSAKNAIQWNRNLLIGILTFGVATPCLANPVVANPADATGLLVFALAIESLLVALLTIPVGLRFVRVFFAWAGITMATWFLLFLFIFIGSQLFPAAGIAPAAFGELGVVFVEAWLLMWLSRRAFFNKSKASTLKGVAPDGFSLKPRVGTLSWGLALFISFLANGASLFVGFGFYIL